MKEELQKPEAGFKTKDKEQFINEYIIARNFFKTVTDATVIYDADNFEIVECNHSFIGLFDLESKKMTVGRNYFSLYTDSLRDKLFSDIREGFRSKQYKSFGFVVEKQKGKQLYLEKYTYPVYDQDDNIILFFEVIRDNTYHVNERYHYKRNQELYGRMMNSIPNIMILLFDPDLNFILAEGPEKDYIGLGKKNSVYQHISGIFERELYKTLEPLFRMALTGTSVSHETRIRDRVYYIQVVPMHNEDKNEVQAGMAIFENITEDKINAEALKRAKKQAERANKAKSEFLANISHEIRTPLNTVVGFSDQLMKTKLMPRQENFLRAIQNASDHLLSIVDETIALSQIEAGEISIREVPFDLPRVISEVQQILSHKAKKKRNVLKFIRKGKKLPLLIGDPARLKQILINLINNAIKFTDEGEILVTTEIKSETVNNVELIFRIKDTGIGIAKDKLKTIFKEYTQADSSITRKYGGSGLGLTISRKLLELQGGSISVDSEVGKGSEFVICLPYKKAAPGTRLDEDTLVVRPSVLKDVKMLVVDDDEMNQLLASTILNNWNLEYHQASNGLEAIELIKQNDYNVILLDIHMPGMSGMEVAQKIRKDLKKDNLYILAVTANVLKNDLRKFMAAGMDGYLLKPFKEAELYEKLVYLLFNENYDAQKQLEETEQQTVEVDTSAKDFDLSDLESTTKGNKSFFNTMINTFIDNAEKQVELLKKNAEERKWKSTGEVAHKMIPSYRHLKIMKIVNVLEYIEYEALRQKKFDNLHEYVARVYAETENVIIQLKKELKN